MHAEVHHHPDVADAPGEGTDATRGRGHEVSVLAFQQVALHSGDRGIVSLDVAHREHDPGALGGVHDLARLLGGGRERLLHEERDPGLDDVESDPRVVLRRHTDAHRIQFFLEEIRRAREIGHVEAVRDDATGLYVRVGDPDDLGDFGVYPNVVLTHGANPDDPDPHRRRWHGPAKVGWAYKRVAVVRGVCRGTRGLRLQR